MQIDHLITPYKLGRPVVSASGVHGAFDSCAVDCPTVFRHAGRFYMMYVGFDGTGYQTALARSRNLTDWEPLGTILRRGSNMAWDSVGMAGASVLADNDLFGTRELMKHDGRYWMMYHAYPNEGYEAGGASIGMAWTTDEQLLDWHFVGEPVLTPGGGAAWESGGLYRSCLVAHGGRFYTFYNAKDVENGDWTEQTGMAESDDMLTWRRSPANPVLPVTPGAWDSRFASDPVVVWDSVGGQWVMFYFGLGPLSACEGIAVSDDLHAWRKFPAPVITPGAAGQLDSLYAHKPSVIFHDGALYHFYCACRPHMPGDKSINFGFEHRCITVARSTPW